MHSLLWPGRLVRQVIDLGICRDLTKGVYNYAKATARQGLLLHGTDTESIRHANKRFRFACRTHHVPSVAPGYFIRPGVLKATLKGKEHRDAVHFLPFAVAGLFGRGAPGRRFHGILTWSICELAALLRDFFDPRAKTWRDAKDLCERFSDWVENDFHELFGETNTSKVHRTVSHLKDEFLLRASVIDGNTGANEALHKYVKRAFQLTNKNRGHAALQMVLAEQISTLISPLEAEQKAVRREGNRRRRVRTRGRPCSAGDLAVDLSLPKLCDALQCDASDCVVLQSGVWLSEEVPRKADGRRSTLWATANLKGRPWFDWVNYRASDGSERYGRARVLVVSLNGSVRRTVVVERAEATTAVPDCPFSAYECTRLRWVHQQGCTEADLEAIDLSAITKVLCVELDWDDWVTRNGLIDFPTTHPIDASDLHQRRFFVNAFAS